MHGAGLDFSLNAKGCCAEIKCFARRKEPIGSKMGPWKFWEKKEGWLVDLLCTSFFYSEIRNLVGPEKYFAELFALFEIPQ